MEVFQDYAYYYNSFYKDKDYKAEAETVDCLIKKYAEGAEKVINFGCGTGKHDIELGKLGYSVKGIDMSSLMIDIAKKNADRNSNDISFEVADIRNYEPKEKYDAVISLFHVISYQNNNEDVLAAFRTARKALESGGIFVFDIWYGPGVLTDRPVLRVKEIEDENNKLIRIARPILHDKTNIVDVAYEVLVIDRKTSVVRMINEIHKMRYFFKPELDMLLRQTGFEMIDNLDCKTLEATDFSSWTSYFIAQAV